MSYKCPLNNEVAFKITIEHVIDQMMHMFNSDFKSHIII